MIFSGATAVHEARRTLGVAAIEMIVGVRGAHSEEAEYVYRIQLPRGGVKAKLHGLALPVGSWAAFHGGR